MNAPNVDIYRGRNPVELPTCTLAEAAHWLDIPPSTVRAWTLGRHQGSAARRFEPVIDVADPARKLLSFQNLVELHVLAAIRRQHGIPLQNVRRAVSFLEDRLGTTHPLATQRMLTDGRDLLVRHGADLLNASKAGQIEMDIVDAYLERIEFGESGDPLRLYPFTRANDPRSLSRQPRAVAIDPRVQFGRPCLVNTGVPTDVLAERFKAGDDPRSLARDYGRDEIEILEALRYEFPNAA